MAFNAFRLSDRLKPPNLDPPLYLQEKSVATMDGSYKEALDRHARMIRGSGNVSEASECFARDNYAVVQAIPLWILSLMEILVACSCFFLQLSPMFTKSVNGKVKHDRTRQMATLDKNWVMWYLIVTPLTKALAPLGFLDVVSSPLRRVAKVVTYIVSSGGADSSKQGWHLDFPQNMASHFADHFPISVLVAGSEESRVDIIPGTCGDEDNSTLEELESSKAKTIVLNKGQALVMGPGLRHRGLAYTEKNIRLFAAFLVGRSAGSSFENTYDVENVDSIKPNRGG